MVKNFLIALGLLGLSACVQQELSAKQLALNAYDAKDYKTALSYIQPEAAAGDADAQFALGHLYRNGYGVSQDYRLALNWFCKAAAQGNIDGLNSVGVMRSKGLFLRKDKRMANQWYRWSAERGGSTAQLNLGRRYLRGKYVEQDFAEAYFWLVLAHKKSARLDHKALEALRDAEENLSKAQISEIERRAGKWEPERDSSYLGPLVRSSLECVDFFIVTPKI